MTIYTIGHSTRTLEAFIAMLAAAQIDCVADVRRFPRSRRHPQFNAEHLAPALAAEGILYRPFAGLGGRREARRDGVSPHLLWREAAFRNYADYAEGAGIPAGLCRSAAASRPSGGSRSCARRRCGGAATAASSRITRSPPAPRSSIFSICAKSSRRCSRRARPSVRTAAFSMAQAPNRGPGTSSC